MIWLLGVALGFLVFSLTKQPVLDRWYAAVGEQIAPQGWTLTAVALIASYTLAAVLAPIAIHEAGHALVGVLVGFRFNSLRIGPVQFNRSLRVSLHRTRGTGAGGWTSLFPVKHDKLILRAIAMLLAGPLSNFSSVAFLLALPYAKGVLSWLFIVISTLLGLMNLIPFRNRAMISDGARILMLLQNRARGKRWLAILKLAEEMRSGVPAEKMTKEFLAKAVAIEDESPDTVTAFAIAHAVAFWCRQDDEAARALETCLRHANLSSPLARVALTSDAAVFQARRRRRIDLAQQWLTDIPEKTEFPWIRPRVEAAILEGRGDKSEALQKLNEVEALIRKAPNPMREMSLRSVARWKAELES